MSLHLRLELKEGSEAENEDIPVGLDTNPPVEQVQPIVVEVISKMTLGRGEDPVLKDKMGNEQSEAEFNRQMALLKNPHVDLSSFYAHERGVSRKHARISINNMRLTVADLGSTNGTFVNNEKLDPNVEYPIKAGDELRLGFLSITLTII